jgi:hypothetical protein
MASCLGTRREVGEVQPNLGMISAWDVSGQAITLQESYEGALGARICDKVRAKKSVAAKGSLHHGRPTPDRRPFLGRRFYFGRCPKLDLRFRHV